MSDRILDLVARLARPRVFVMGDLILDRYVWGSVTRVSPEAPVQILKVDREEFRPGGAANVVHNLAALGARVACGGVVAASNVSSLPEVVGDGGVLFDPLRVGGIAAVLERLLDDAELRSRLSAQARERAKGFTWDRCAATVQAVLERAGDRR